MDRDELIAKLEARLVELRSNTQGSRLPPNARTAEANLRAGLIDEIEDRLRMLKAGEVDQYA